MKIILVGGGKVGTALARQLSEEGHNVTVVDTNKARVEHLTESYDVLGIVGNGSSITTLSEAGIEDADVFIAVTGSDELNLLCCMFAKKAGHCHGIARVRNPSYSHELDFIKKQIGISAIINPEMAAAKEISHLLRFPGASKIDTFADGRVRLIKFALPDALDGVAIREIPTRLKSDILVCAVERDGGVIIPNGNFVLQKGDQVTFLATQEKAHAFFQQLHLPVQPVRNALIVGGGAIAYYLSQELLENHVRVRIVERDAARCVELAEQLPGAQILNEDGSNREFLLSEGLESTEAFVALTNIDEENVLLTLFAKKHSNGKLVTKVNRLEFDDILAGLDLGSVVYPKYMTCDYIVPVSYTHLDVYKRQPLCRPPCLQRHPHRPQRGSPCGGCCGRRTGSPAVQRSHRGAGGGLRRYCPVSYTHLDVYKRQAQGRCQRRARCLPDLQEYFPRDPDRTGDPLQVQGRGWRDPVQG